MPSPLERALSRFRLRRPSPLGEGPATQRLSAAAFRVAVEQRLSNVERDLGDLKNRLNGLMFLVAGTVIAQVVLKALQ